jgi:hypothetical protein
MIQKGNQAVPAADPFEDIPLTGMQQEFVDALLRSPTLDYAAAHTKARARLGKPPVQEPRKAGRMMAMEPNVRAELRRRRAYIEAAADAQIVQIEARLARAALGDVRELFDPTTGALRRPDTLGDDAAAMIAGYDEEEYTKGGGEDVERGTRRKVKLIDPLSAAKLLMARRGIASQPNEGGSGAGIVANIQINIG